MLKSFLYLFIACQCSITCLAQQKVSGTEKELFSPDKKLSVKFYQQLKGKEKTFYYELSYQHKVVIKQSVMDLQLDNYLSESAMALPVNQQKKWFDNLEITNISFADKDTLWKPVYGENATIRDHYNVMMVETVKSDQPMYRMNIEIRAYNEGLAFRYCFPENEKGSYFRVIAENTEFTLPEGTLAWAANWAQAPYSKITLKNWQTEVERPLTLELANGLFASLIEANMVDYARTKFKLSKTKPNTIETAMFTSADLISPFTTPWRAVMVAENAALLAENNALILNLNKPTALQNTDWIKPGKIMRVMSQTNKDAFENIDFAVKRNLQYILFDWKWYGPAFSFSSDATKVAIPDFDLPAIINYGKERGIGVWLYVNQQALLAQSDSLFAVYKKWGVAGVKFGFVQSGSHRWTTWLEKTIQQAADNQMMVNIHDDWRPTGEQRTWPNLMTAEGIRGNEEMPDATNNTVMPFTRFLAGAADYTICYFDKRIKTTHAHQLALAAIYFSPLQTLYWYDKPSFYQNEPELEFWDKIPASWDETRVLQGRPGEFVSTARRKGNDWFIGTITNTSARNLKLNFSFLPKGKTYTAKIYADDEAIQTATQVGITTLKINSSTVLETKLKPSGGQAIWLQQN